MDNNSPDAISWVSVLTGLSKVKLGTSKREAHHICTQKIPKICVLTKPNLCVYCEITKPYTHEVPTILTYKNVSPTVSNPFLEAIFQKINFQSVIRDFYQDKKFGFVYKITVEQNPYEIVFLGVRCIEANAIIEIYLTQTFQHNDNGAPINFSKRKVIIGFHYS